MNNRNCIDDEFKELTHEEEKKIEEEWSKLTVEEREKILEGIEFPNQMDQIRQSYSFLGIDYDTFVPRNYDCEEKK